ncbi:unnamed protein product [Aphanomyces euteiches]
MSTGVDVGASRAHENYRIRSADIWALGVTISAQSLSWNNGFTAGFGSFLIVALLVGAAYVSLILCLGEIMSALPFAGGAYGLARCTLGFTAGFLVAAFEIVEYIAYTATAMTSFTHTLAYVAPATNLYQPIIWFLVYIICLSIHIYGAAAFWRLNYFFAAASLLPTITWIVGSIPYLDYKKQLQPDVMFIDGFSGFMRAFPCATWLFVGLEALNTVGDEIKDPRIIVPKGQRFAIATVFCTGITSIIISGGLPPGIRAWPDVMNTKLLTSVGSSNLVSKHFQTRFFKNETPAISLVMGAVNTLDNICMLSAAFAYSTQCYGYIFLKKYFHHLERKFHSPLGVFGAYFSMSVWMVQIISIAFFQDDNFAAGGIFLAMLMMLLIYYHRIAKHNQMFSKEEEKILFSTHVTAFNKMRARKKSLAMETTSELMKPLARAAQRIFVGKQPSSKVFVGNRPTN